MNILFLMADEMAASALGSADVRTPNLDRLCARGRVFSAAYTPSPICVPTRAAIACGRPVHEIGFWSSAEPYDGSVRSWMHALRDGGVHTASIGKLHYRGGDDYGFTEEILPMQVAGDGWVQGLLRQPLADYTATREMSEDIGAGLTDYTRFDLQVTQSACNWLAAPARANAPWAAFVSWVSPHYPLRAPEEYFDLYHPEDFEAEAEPVPDHPVLTEIAAFFDHDRYFSPRSRGTARAAYYALCTFLDAQVGKVLKSLEAAGLAEDTVVVFASDHGEMLGEKGFWGKSTMYDSSARVPLVIAGPGVSAGTCETPVALTDLAATFAGICKAPWDGRGTSLLDPIPAENAVISEYHDGGSPVGITMLRWRNWKYIHYAEGHPPQLFDLAEDPHETTDLAAARPNTAEDLHTRLTAIVDPEAANARALRDQARRIDDLGGRGALESLPQWNFTPTGA
ncbi:MAG: sulfatase-like hydrolase/transferase [Pseudomonadota bacterium]